MLEDKESLINIMEAMKQNGICEFHMELGKGKVSIRRPDHGLQIQRKAQDAAPGALSQPQQHETASMDAKQEEPTVSDNRTDVVSPLVGVFYQAPSPNDPPFVRLGQEVKEGQTLCIIEAMKTMNEIKAPENGNVLDILADNGQVIEYGQILFRLQKEPAT